MNEGLRKKWILVGAIWGGVILGSFYNFYEIEHIKSERYKNEIRRMDQLFLNNHAEKINRIFNEEARLYHHIASVGIGILFVESQLQQMTAAHQLTDMRIEPKTQTNGEDTIPVKLYISGTLSDMVALLVQMKNEVPYLIGKQIEWSENSGNSNLRFSLLFDYRYRITDTGQDA